MNCNTDRPGKFWLYVGIIFVCTGIGVGVGAVILALYFWSDIKNTILESKNNSSTDDLWDMINQKSSKWYDNDTLEGMK